MNNINLLPKKNVKKDHSRVILTLRLSAIGLSCLVVGLSLWLFYARFDTTVATQKQKQQELSSSLEQLQSRAVKVLLLEERLTDIGKILPQRSTYENLISQVSSLLPSTVSIDQLSIKTGTLSITISAPSISILNNVSDTFSGLVSKKQLFRLVTIDAITIDNGKNSLTMKATLL